MAQPLCFVIQPFDSKFNKRFEDVFKPAIEAAGLEAYRVDRDVSVAVPIEAIEEKIGEAAVCLADITIDNPNVWYELGFAFASMRRVVMVCCSNERREQVYPFDIRHRTVLSYSTESPRDFEQLKSDLTLRLKSNLATRETVRRLEENENSSLIEGLTAAELILLAEIAGNVYLPNHGVPVYTIKRAVGRKLTSLGASLGFRRLTSRGLVEIREEYDHDGDPFSCVFPLDLAWDWIERHEDLFEISRPEPVHATSVGDIPF